MDVVKLRKLAHKSIWTYGKYDGYTVNDIMIANKTYLIWAYYNLEKVSFIDEILEHFAEIYPKFKLIDKPGKDHDYFEDNISRSYTTMSLLQLRAAIAAKKINGQSVSILLKNAYKDAKIKASFNRKAEVTKGNKLQALNHGRAFNVDDELVYKKPKR